MSLVRRTLEPRLRKSAAQYPVVTLTGPRQSGKTTLTRQVFPDHEYVSLEAPDLAAFARDDPRGFLSNFNDGVILDEVQNVPSLLSYIQTLVDEDPTPGRFVLTGSQHFALSDAISQSLAGRTAILHLLPLSHTELLSFPEPPTDLWEVLWSGGYPRIFHRHIPPDDWLANYTATYVQRDVRQVLNIGDLTGFTTFLKLAAGRTAQELNLSDLGADAGVSHNTARAWISVLETSFLVFELPPYFRNLRKRLIKAPKLHFLDSGLACFLLGIHSPDQLVHHPLRGAIFETWVVSEIYKARIHAGLPPAMFHLRQTRGAEVDCIVETAGTVLLTEAKSGATVHNRFLDAMNEATDQIAGTQENLEITQRLIYGGTTRQHRSRGEIIPWSLLSDVSWTPEHA
ncbi:MAG: ATP-binding protein [Bradymonadaceae bacterium]